MRSLFRFGLPTLFAAMLLCISVAGWQRDRQNDAKEQAALDALAKENAGIRAMRRSELSALYAESKTNAARSESADAWLPGDANPIVTLRIDRTPSDAARRRVLDLPHLERLQILGHVPRIEGTSYPEPPPLEEALGRALPELPPATEMPDEPPPLPRGTPLSDKERIRLLRAIDVAWHDAARKPGPENVLRYVESDDPHEPDIVVARRGSAGFRLERLEGDVSRIVPSRLWIIGEEGHSAVQRRWEGGKWRLEFAARSLEEGRPFGAVEESLPDERMEFEAPGMEFVAENDVDAGDFVNAERLEDGGYALRRRPSSVVDPVSGIAEKGWIVVGPGPNYVVKRSDFIEVNSPSTEIRRTDLYETEGETARLVRRSTWFHEIRGYDGPRTPETRIQWQVRYAWELEPDLPGDLFDPARQGEDFFTSEPPPSFRWWYVTGTLSLAAFVGIGAMNVRGVAKRRFSRREEGEGDDADLVAVDRSKAPRY